MKALYHSHQNYEIFYFHEGSGNYLIGDRIHILQPGDLLMMHGMTLHCPNMNRDDKYIRTVISFDPGYIPAIAGQLFTIDPLEPFERCKNLKIALRGKDKKIFEQKLYQLNEYYDKRDTVKQNRLRIAFCELMLDIYYFYDTQLEQKVELPTEKEKTVQKVIAFVEQHFEGEVNLDQLACNVHLNKHHLSRKFKEVTGTTIFSYLYQRRINEAKILFILYQDISVTEVCYKVGFKNLSHFSRMFKQQVDLSPDEYKNQNSKRTYTNFPKHYMLT